MHAATLKRDFDFAPKCHWESELDKLHPSPWKLLSHTFAVQCLCSGTFLPSRILNCLAQWQFDRGLSVYFSVLVEDCRISNWEMRAVLLQKGTIYNSRWKWKMEVGREGEGETDRLLLSPSILKITPSTLKRKQPM